jgi:hypothetical protein
MTMRVFQYLMQQLTFAPDERLFYRNNWQEGLVPKQETRQMKMHKFKIFLEDELLERVKDKDGVYLIFRYPNLLRTIHTSFR